MSRGEGRRAEERGEERGEERRGEQRTGHVRRSKCRGDLLNSSFHRFSCVSFTSARRWASVFNALLSASRPLPFVSCFESTRQMKRQSISSTCHVTSHTREEGSESEMGDRR